MESTDDGRVEALCVRLLIQKPSHSKMEKKLQRVELSQTRVAREDNRSQNVFPSEPLAVFVTRSIAWLERLIKAHPRLLQTLLRCGGLTFKNFYKLLTVPDVCTCADLCIEKSLSKAFPWTNCKLFLSANVCDSRANLLILFKAEKFTRTPTLAARWHEQTARPAFSPLPILVLLMMRHFHPNISTAELNRTRWVT